MPGMHLSYGTHAHGPSECKIGIDRTPILNEAKVPTGLLESWTIEGMLTSVIGATDIDAQITALMAAYAVNGGDLVLYLPDGVTPSSSALFSAKTLGGTRVTLQPSFPTNEGAERVTYSHYMLKVEAEIPVAPVGMLTAYHESLKFNGGSPVVGWIKPAVGLPQQQLWKQYDTFRVVQEGSATGYYGPPLIGVQVGIPIWPAALLPQATNFDGDSPEREGSGFKNYKVAWHYEFESLTPLVGFATPWPLSI